MLTLETIVITLLSLQNVKGLNQWGANLQSLKYFTRGSIKNNARLSSKIPLFAGSGFGKPSGKNKRNNDESYIPYYNTNEIINNDEAMSQFFTNYEEWTPLFRSLISSSNAPASSFLGEEISFGQSIDFSDMSTPWTLLEGIPTDQDKLGVMTKFLDAAQKSLTDIPVNEAVKEDAADLRFIEEGRRLLVISRFHVLFSNQKQRNDATRIDIYDELFTTCWSEIAQHRHVNEVDTGSLIVLPNTLEISDVRRFADMNIHKPLTWLGIENDFEVESLDSAYPAIRLIHKLSDIPIVEPSVESA